MSDGRIPVVFEALGAGLKMFRWVVLALLALFLFSGVQTIQQDQVGILLRLGKPTGISPGQQVKSPGLVLAAPYPIDRLVVAPGPKKAITVAVDEAWAPLDAGGDFNTIDPLEEGYFLTGDRNVLQAKLVVRYNVTDPLAFRLLTADPEAMIAASVQTAASQLIAETPIEQARRAQQTAGEGLANGVLQRAQQRLDAIGVGVTLTSVSFDELHPPRHVSDAFNEVRRAETEISTRQRIAQAAANRMVSQAQAEKNRIIKEAEGEKAGKIAAAESERRQFEKLYQSYRESPKSVWRSMYVGTVEKAVSRVGKIVFAEPGSRVLLSGDAK